MTTKLNHRTAVALTASLFLLAGMSLTANATLSDDVVSVGTINVSDGLISFASPPDPVTICNQDLNVLAVDWNLRETRAFDLGQVRQAEFGFNIRSLASGAEASPSYTHQFKQPTSTTADAGTAPSFAVPPGTVGEAYAVTLYGKFWENILDIEAPSPTLGVSPEFTVIYVNCSAIPDGVPMLVCVPVVFTDAAGVEIASTTVTGEACGLGPVDGVCSADGNTCVTTPMGECAGAGAWTVSAEGVGTPGTDEADGSMACGGVEVSKCTTVGNGTASARQCIHAGGSGEGPGECSVSKNGNYNGEVKCEDPPMPGEAGRYIRIIINGSED